MSTTKARRPRESRPLPPPFPPESRTVGQLVAETLRFYGRRFWATVALGVPPSVLAVVATQLDRWQALGFVAVAGSIVMTGCFLAAAIVVSGARPDAHTLITAAIVGVAIYIPVPFLAPLFVLPALAWLALVGLAVPATIIERLSLREALARGLALGRADYVHALGGLATLVILVYLTGQVMALAIRGWSGQAVSIAAFLASLLISPVLFVGPVLLYYDQEARLRARMQRTKAAERSV